MSIAAQRTEEGAVLSVNAGNCVIRAKTLQEALARLGLVLDSEYGDDAAQQQIREGREAGQ